MKLRYLIRSLAIGSLALAASSAQAGILDGLNAYWTFDADATDTATAIGSTASAVDDNGVVVPPARPDRSNPVTFDRAGKFGNAANYDGVDSYISVPDSVDINKEGQDLSISAWFQVDAFDTGWQALLAKGEGSNYRIARQGDNTNFMAYAGGSRDIRYDPAPAASPTMPDDGVWHHVAATTQNGGLTSLWVDGMKVSDAGQDPAVASMIINERSTDPAELWIGNNPGATGREWEGGIDEVAIWGRVLSEGEIAAIWNGGDGASIPSLVPEPASGLLMAMGMLGLLAAGRTRRKLTA